MNCIGIEVWEHVPKPMEALLVWKVLLQLFWIVR